MPPRSGPGSAGEALDHARKSVVKVLVQADAPDYEQPWQTQGTSSSSGSGAIVETSRGLRILTNAHVVEHEVFVEIKRHGKSKRFVAKVEGIGHTCDLALLTVADAEFFQGALPLPLGELPRLGDEVTVLGYPVGGTRLSVTQGIVSRIELQHYAQSQRRLLSVQIDAAINEGNSGGPVIDGAGQIVGVAAEGYEDGQNLGYMIGGPVVAHFLEDMDRGIPDGFPDLGIVTQPLESAAHRQFLGLPPDLSAGVLIVDVVCGGSAWGMVRRGDVLLDVEGSAVSADGSVEAKDQERFDWQHLIAQRHVDERIWIRVWRNQSEHDFRVRLKPPKPLVPEAWYLEDQALPRYYVFGGIVFAQLTNAYLATWDESAPPPELLAAYEHGLRTPARSEVVLLQKVLADEVNRGYHDLDNLIVERVQGKKIRSLGELIKLVEEGKEPFVRFESAHHTLVIDREQALARREEILERFGVPADRSRDLRDATGEED